MRNFTKLFSELSEHLVYGDIAPNVLDCIYDALHLCSIRWINNEPLRNESSGKIVNEIDSCFDILNPKRYSHSAKNKNHHIRDGANVQSKNSRLSNIVVSRFEEIQFNLHKQKKDDLTLYIPSPISLLFDSLSVPTDLSSVSHSLIACRSLLFLIMSVSPFARKEDTAWEKIRVEELESIMDSENKYYAKNDFFPIRGSRVGEFLQHFLALKGFYVIRFGTIARKRINDKHKLEVVINEYFRQRNLRGLIKDTQGKKRIKLLLDNLLGQNNKNIDRVRLHEYELSPLLDEPPIVFDIVNEIVGSPVPIKGINTVLYGGLRRGNNDSLVMSVYGAAGTGKTTFALSMASAMGTCGTNCFYISTEEHPNDLESRLHSITPTYIKDISISNKNYIYFDNLRDENRQIKGDYIDVNSMTKYIDRINNIILGYRKHGLKELLGIPPLLIVIDSLHNPTMGNEFTELNNWIAKFISHCRSMKAIVLILSPEELPKSSELSYLVDLFISLEYSGTDKVHEKPKRIFRLKKTRFQLSRPGSHIFHMSGRGGFRISPQLSSQLDQEVQQGIHLVDENKTIDILNKWDHNMHYTERFKPVKVSKYADIYFYSHILVYGHGSTGKSAFGLRLLTDPIDNKYSANWPRRVLIISFLYSKNYYDELFKNIKRRILQNTDSYTKEYNIDCISFAPGFMNPEDMLSEISTKIGSAKLKGQPYTGVLLDGIHNVFLDFPNIQDRHLVWPILHRMLSINRLTVVTTFSTFSLDKESDNETQEEKEIQLKEHLPFLHAFAHRKDYYITIEKIKDGSIMHPDCILKVKECIKQTAPQTVLLWNRKTLTLSPPMKDLKYEKQIPLFMEDAR